MLLNVIYVINEQASFVFNEPFDLFQRSKIFLTINILNNDVLVSKMISVI